MLEQPLQNNNLQFLDWGLVPYSEKMQTDLVDAISAGALPETIVFCSHPPVVTLGRKADRASDINGWNGDVIEVRRGGRATYHGPSQIVVYPLLDLKKAHKNFGVHDVMGLIKFLENMIVDVLAEVNLVGVPGHKKNIERTQSDLKTEVHKNIDKSMMEKNEANIAKEQLELMTGVWVNNKKICSLGIAVSKWISFHGLALNIEPDPQAFRGINPCGFSFDTMTDLVTELRKNGTSEPRIDSIRAYVSARILRRFSNL